MLYNSPGYIGSVKKFSGSKRNAQLLKVALLFFLLFRLVVFKASALWADAFYKLICPYVCLSVFYFIFEVPFKRLFDPTSESWMSNIFRD